MVTNLFCPRCGLPLWERREHGWVVDYWCRNMHTWVITQDHENKKVVISGAAE